MGVSWPIYRNIYGDVTEGDAEKLKEFYHAPLGTPYQRFQRRILDEANNRFMRGLSVKPSGFASGGYVSPLMTKIQDMDAWREAESFDGAVHKAFAAIKKDSFMPPLKIMLLCHFSFARDRWPGDRTTNAYRLFVQELESSKLIRATTAIQRVEADAPEWLHETTARGNVFVQALTKLPLPIEAEPKWVMPT